MKTLNLMTVNDTNTKVVIGSLHCDFSPCELIYSSGLVYMHMLITRLRNLIA